MWENFCESTKHQKKIKTEWEITARSKSRLIKVELGANEKESRTAGGRRGEEYDETEGAFCLSATLTDKTIKWKNQ